MGISIPKTQVIWASPFHFSLVICVRVRVKGDAHITRVLEMAMSKKAGIPYHCDSASLILYGKSRGDEVAFKEVS